MFYKLNQCFRKPLIKLSSVILGVGLLSACSLAPETVNFEQPNTSFVRVAQSPDSFVGSQVRWGGIVARVENLEQDTLVEIVNLPLDARARPVGDANTSGRFIARVQGFLDPLIYKEGKEITVVGVLNQSMPGKIGQHQVNFPVVDSSGHHLWKERESRVYVSSFSSWDPYWFGHVGYRWRSPYYGYSRYNYCPIHGAFHHHSVRHSYRSRENHSHLNAAPGPTNRIQPLSEQGPNREELERATLRQRDRQNVEPNKPAQVRRPVVPENPTRIQPRIHKVKIPKPTPPRNPRPMEKVK